MTDAQKECDHLEGDQIGPWGINTPTTNGFYHRLVVTCKNCHRCVDAPGQQPNVIKTYIVLP